jgi:hypothetical protein
MEEIRNLFKILGGKPEGKTLLGRPRLTQEDNIKTDLRKLEWEDADRMHLAQDKEKWLAVLNSVRNLWVP